MAITLASYCHFFIIMKEKLLIITLLLNFLLTYAQKYDYNWIMGYNSADSLSTYNSKFGLTYFDFNQKPVDIYKKWLDINFDKTNTSMSSKDGSLIFSTNGIKVLGKNNKPVRNGDTLAPSKKWYKYGQVIKQGSLSLPMPDSDSLYVLFYCNTHFPYTYRDYYAIFDSSVGVNGAIIKKEEELITDSLAFGKITAVKHANGRDWWVHIGNIHNTHYMILVEPNKVAPHHYQKIGYKAGQGVGQAVFSPDGTKFIENNSVNNKIGQDIMIYDFNRCNGMLSNPYRMHFDSAGWSGIGVSPNSRFLYFSDGWRVIQYDLQASDIKASEITVALWDYLVDPFSTGFYLMQLGPDGKIYICTSGATSYMHYIDSPDEKGLACNVKQRGIKLPTPNAWSIPNHPNYRLGALKGSPCDTLNKSVGVKEIKEGIKIYPNPAADILNIQLPDNQQYTIIFYDISGRKLKEENITAQAEIDTSTFPEGMLFCEIRRDNKVIFTKKIVILH
jgi:hypothetical protein